MNELVKFDFKGSSVSIVDRDGILWYVAKDVCNALGLTNVTEAVRALDEDEKHQLDTNIINSEVGGRGTIIISESGMYKLVFRSRKEVAKEFTRWVTHEVLPTIRRKGFYVSPKITNSTQFKEITEDIRIALLCALDNYPSKKAMAKELGINPYTLKGIIQGRHPSMARRNWLKLRQVVEGRLIQQNNNSRLDVLEKRVEAIEECTGALVKGMEIIHGAITALDNFVKHVESFMESTNASIKLFSEYQPVIPEPKQIPEPEKKPEFDIQAELEASIRWFAATMPKHGTFTKDKILAHFYAMYPKYKVIMHENHIWQEIRAAVNLRTWTENGTVYCFVESR